VDGTTVAESDLGGNWTAAYGIIRGRISSRVDLPSEAVHYYFADRLKSTSVVTDNSGNIEEESDYYPYGGEIVVTSGDSNHYKFTGKERDTESGLDMFGARYYGSSLGRFMTPDWATKPTNVPYAHFGNPQSLNLYSYVNNNPTTTRDPDGHDDGGTAAVAVVAGCAASGACAAAAVGAVAGAGQASLVVLPVAAMVVAVEQPPMEQGDPMTPGYVPAPAIATGAPPSTATSVQQGTPASTSQQGVVDNSPAQMAGGPKAANAPGVTAGGQATDQYGNKLGPSGKPQVNETNSNTREGARNNALNEGSGAVEHANPAQGQPHFHPTDSQGDKKPASTHHDYPDN
jgi:RHS repeat-associated protein